MDKPREIIIHQSANRPNLLLGAPVVAIALWFAGTDFNREHNWHVVSKSTDLVNRAWQIHDFIETLSGPNGEVLIVGPVMWGLAGLGMGMAYAPITMAVLNQAAPGREGAASSSLQLTDVLGVALGGDLGADTVKIEPPGGDPMRRLGPFYGGAEASSVMEMGGHGHATEETRTTEASIRGFWQAYRPLMGY